MKKCFVTIKDEVNCVIAGLDDSHHETLWKKFGIFAEGYFFMPMFKMGRWDGKVRYYAKTGKTYNRLLEQILPLVESWGYDFELKDERLPDKCAPTLRAAHGLFDGVEINGKPFELRPYQVECVDMCIENGSGIIIAGTGAGKTSITGTISHIYASAGNKVITIVPSADLVDQTFDWYELMGLDVGKYSGSDKDINHQNVVATWQALQYNPSILQDFQAVIWDEAHGCKADVAAKLLNEHGRHIAYRFGVTGTLPKPETDQMSLFTTLGSVLKEVTAAWLMANGYLAQVEIEPVEIHELYSDEEFKDYDAEKAFLSKSVSRMEKIADLIISKCAKYGNTLVLVNSVSFGNKLASLIKGAVSLNGGSKKEQRKEQYALFEDRDDMIVIATAGIASTGISIDRVFCLLLVDAGKSFIRAIQSIGRALRIGRGKTHAYVIDVHSKKKWAMKHFRERVKWYKQAEYPMISKQTISIRT